MNLKNKISVIIPYNKDRGYLEQALKSAEINGQPVPHKSEGSVGHNVNQALRDVKTPYFCILAEDDWLHHSANKWRIPALEYQKADFIHSYGVAVRSTGHRRITWTKPDPSLEEMIQLNRICGGTLIYKTDLLDKFGGWDESLRTAEEYEWHLRLLAGGAKLGFLPKDTYYYRRHEKQKSVGNLDRSYQAKRQEQIQEIRERYR